jgi:hypothetical protein
LKGAGFYETTSISWFCCLGYKHSSGSVGKEIWHHAPLHGSPQGRRRTDPEAAAEVHQKDLDIQDKYGVKALRYWFNQEKGEVFCLFDAPSAEAAEAVHREAHGLLADEIVEIEEGS